MDHNKMDTIKIPVLKNVKIILISHYKLKESVVVKMILIKSNTMEKVNVVQD